MDTPATRLDPSRIAAALERGEFRLLFQPRVRLDSGHVEGAEVLLRWRPDENTLLAPGVFMAELEQSGAVKEVDRWAVTQAIAQLRRWHDEGVATLPLSVNVSEALLADPDFEAAVREALASSTVEPRLLELEVPQGAALAEPGRLVPALQALREYGVRILLDRFGPDQGSPGGLDRPPVHGIKIAPSALQDIAERPEAAAAMRRIVGYGRTFGLHVIAVGVNTPAQYGRIFAERCDAFQGNLFSPAVDAEAFAALVRGGRRFESGTLSAIDGARTVLLVDDEPNVLTALKRLLRPEGYRLITAKDGPAGLAALAENNVDLVISDQRMPGMSGVEFLTRVKALRPETVRMVLSGYTELESITNAINEGAIAKFLTKPWDDEQLRATVAEALRVKALGDENRRLAAALETSKLDLEAANARLERLLERKDREAARNGELLALVQEVVQQVPWPVLCVDPDHQVTLANLAAADAFSPEGSLLGEALESCLGDGVGPWLESGAHQRYSVDHGGATFDLERRDLRDFAARGTLIVAHRREAP